MRGATCNQRPCHYDYHVSIHAPHARGDGCACLASTACSRFNPRPSCEGRPSYAAHWAFIVCFNPRPSCEGRPRWRSGCWSRSWFQSTPLMRGATRMNDTQFASPPSFNPRPSCEGRPYLGRIIAEPIKFQSTPLMRGATHAN